MQRYVLSDEDGEFHAPKDNKRRELEIDPKLEAECRTQVLADAATMVDRGVILSSGWFLQLGRQTSSLLVAACEAKGEKMVAVKLPKEKKKKGVFSMSHIVEERQTEGKAGTWFLVEWEGYAPEWESWRINGVVGGPVSQRTHHPATHACYPPLTPDTPDTDTMVSGGVGGLCTGVGELAHQRCSGGAGKPAHTPPRHTCMLPSSHTRHT